MSEATHVVAAEPRAWRLTIRGEPVAKARPRLATINGHARAFTPAPTRRYEDIVRQRATLEWSRPLLTGVAIALQVTFFRGIPASWAKGKREAALLGTLRPTGRPDLDNLLKACTDALNGVVYLDDSLIVEANARKFYGIEPRVELALSWASPSP